MQKKLTICSKKKKKNFLCSQFYAKNVAIYAFFWGKIEKVGKLTDVKNLTNFMSAHRAFSPEYHISTQDGFLTPQNMMFVQI